MKPAFQPLTMAQVTSAPLSGLTHVSTFSGAGGTCLGFRLAGFQTLWANDIDDHARACYRANMESPIDGRDIKDLTAPDILTAIGLPAGALDVFEGSPPCTAFSTAGKRAKGWGQTKTHAGHTQTNIEDLFYDWLRLLDGLRPRAFVAENVAGMVKGVAKGYFKDILRRMKALGYQVEARVLDAQWLGVPQSRSRVIFIGVRDDLKTLPAHPIPFTYRYSVRDALAGLSLGASDLQPAALKKTWQMWRVLKGLEPARHHGLVCADWQRPSPCVMKDAGNTTTGLIHPEMARRFTIAEIKRLCSFPDDYVMDGPYAQQWARLGNSVPPLMAKAIGLAVRDVLLGAA